MNPNKKNMKKEIDLDEFVAQCLAAISDIGAYSAFVKAMENRGFSEKEIEDGFREVGEKVGMDL